MLEIIIGKIRRIIKGLDLFEPIWLQGRRRVFLLSKDFPHNKLRRMFIKKKDPDR
ncbi:MAG: hypothetical protein LiPW16_491 [Microgenomates group bacterium LiPW_16]|nr:MAG: hypothetical protein LiPW16_491 [Microgenomates group bacterium LiPW_16]